MDAEIPAALKAILGQIGRAECCRLALVVSTLRASDAGSVMLDVMQMCPFEVRIVALAAEPD